MSENKFPEYKYDNQYVTKHNQIPFILEFFEKFHWPLKEIFVEFAKVVKSLVKKDV